MLSIQRREEIKRLLLEKKAVSIGEIKQRFQVSDETARRDIAALCSEGFCSKTYGGAALVTRSTSTTSSDVKKFLCVEEKRKIARLAATRVRPNDCVFLDHSTTVAELCVQIMTMPLTVVTNSLWVVDELSNRENIKLILTGGGVRSQDRGMFGMETLDFLKQHYFDKAFFSCKSLHPTKGVFDSSEQAAAMRRLLCEQSEETCLMVDHTKFGVPGFVNILSYRELDVLITDQAPESSWLDQFSRNQVEVLFDSL